MADSRFLIVAIDGGAAAGKSSAARALSERFHFLHADTGSYYRAVTAEMLRLRRLPVGPAGRPCGPRRTPARDPSIGPGRAHRGRRPPLRRRNPQP